LYFRNGPEDHVDLVERMQKSLKVAQKTVSSLLKELAVEEVQRLKQADPLVSGKQMMTIEM
jgi:siroheme synthase